MMESWKNNGIALLASALLIVSGESKAETIVTHRLLETVGHSTLQCEFASEVFANPSLQSLHYPVSLNTPVWVMTIDMPPNLHRWRVGMRITMVLPMWMLTCERARWCFGAMPDTPTERCAT